MPGPTTARRSSSPRSAARAIEKQFDRAAVSADLDTIEEIRPEEATATVPAKLSGLTDGQDFIVDVVDPTEEATDRRTDFLNDLTEQFRNRESAGYQLPHAYTGDDRSAQRQNTLDIADFVWRLAPVASRGEINYMLELPKTNGPALNAKDRYLEVSFG